MKQQFVVTHTVRQTEIPTLLGSWFTNTSSVNIAVFTKRIVSTYIVVKNNTLKCWSTDDRPSSPPPSPVSSTVSVGCEELLFHELHRSCQKRRFLSLLAGRHLLGVQCVERVESSLCKARTGQNTTDNFTWHEKINDCTSWPCYLNCHVSCWSVHI